MTSGECPRIVLASVDSTNTYLKEHRELWHHPFLAVRASEQTAGRGRQRRAWHMGAGLDLALSVLWRPVAAAPGMNCLTLAAGLAVHRALSPRCPGLTIKWPNDLYHHDRKCAGILCEQVAAPDGPLVIVGVGVNANSTTFPDDLAGRATSLRLATGEDQDLDALADAVIASLLRILPETRDPLAREMHEAWLRVSSSPGSRVRYEIDGAPRVGVITAVNRDGSLEITEPGGTMVRSFGGDALVVTDGDE